MNDRKEPIAVSQDEWDEIHECVFCSECELIVGCQTEPNFGCRGEERARRARHPEPSVVAQLVAACRENPEQRAARTGNPVQKHVVFAKTCPRCGETCESGMCHRCGVL